MGRRGGRGKEWERGVLISEANMAVHWRERLREDGPQRLEKSRPTGRKRVYQA